ncbi:hypothetical protein C8J25_105224 [Sphingomonas faeni]|uniref:Lipoprotein n=1 Tax=Sphingomonas faeni TaxID=185950 RepID=A0A2T5U4N1_9SPHN|nr:hypothetical protein [Sphingomonas faeni]PTW46443.1 hypothetical protein C8J25_105224 [Sphingomonas faeni]
MRWPFRSFEKVSVAVKAPILAVSACAILLSGCAGKGEVDATGGISAVRSVCPPVAIPAATGDITLFDPVTSRDQSAIDVVAFMTNVRSTCADATDQVVTNVTFDIRARRSRTEAARDVTLPYFITVVRGGSAVVAKRIGRVALHFDAGQALASASGTTTATVSRAAATLPEDVREKLTRRRKAGDQDAAVDPLSTPEVRQAVLRASFEALVGFQLTDDQLKYNATR